MASTAPSNDVEDDDVVAAEAVAQMRFPAGTKALYKRGRGGKDVPLPDEGEVFILNVSLQRVSFRIKDDRVKPSEKHGYREVQITMLPGEAREIRVYDARRALDAMERRGGDLKIVVAPPKGNCENKLSFTFPPADENGVVPPGAREFRTCPYANCPHHPQVVTPDGVSGQWSIWQSQHRIAKLGTPPAIRRWIESFDPRSEVVAWALFTIQRREDSRRDRMMLGGRSPRTSQAVY